jgi:hypothetical protein
MATKIKHSLRGRLPLALLLPLLFVGLFFLLQGNRAIMDFWVFQIMAPVEQGLGRLWSYFPFSGLELCIALFVLGNLVWLVRAVVLFWRERAGAVLFRRVLALVAVWLWLWCGLCWLWNAAYYASTFTQRSGLEPTLYSVTELSDLTAYFAQNAARLSTQVQRDEEGHFAESRKDCFQRGTATYENLSKEFSCLSLRAVPAKPLLCSRLQSILGFTGMYFPFTGEANVNIDAPACLVPATITHEMAHQRMVASELEANFVGIAACTTCDDVVFQYSGYLMGLIQLANALYPADAQAWQTIVSTYFTAELITDWNDNNAYWAALESSVSDAAETAYDSFLKGNDQELGMRSYGACVDLLIAYYGPKI